MHSLHSRLFEHAGLSVVCRIEFVVIFTTTSLLKKWHVPALQKKIQKQDGATGIPVGVTG